MHSNVCCVAIRSTPIRSVKSKQCKRKKRIRDSGCDAPLGALLEEGDRHYNYKKGSLKRFREGVQDEKSATADSFVRSFSKEVVSRLVT